MSTLNLRKVPHRLLRECKLVAVLKDKTLKDFILECMERGVREEMKKWSPDFDRIDKELNWIDGVAKDAPTRHHPE